MSGVAICRYLLANDAPVLAAVVKKNIMAGIIPLKTELPAIGIEQISDFDFLTVKMSSSVTLRAERVQVTILAKTYPTQKSILALVRAALKNAHGAISTFTVDSILPEGAGSDLYDAEARNYAQQIDFIVRYRA